VEQELVLSAVVFSFWRESTFTKGLHESFFVPNCLRQNAFSIFEPMNQPENNPKQGQKDQTDLSQASIESPQGAKFSSIAATVETVHKNYSEGRTRLYMHRMENLRQLKNMLVEHETEFLEALQADLGKSSTEAWATEVGYVVSEINNAVKELKGWMKPEKVGTNLANQPGSSSIIAEPYGVALIIGPWNYPINLMLSPLVGAIAAGNCAVLKPSELTEHTTAVLAELLPQYLDSECFAIVQGGPEETAELLEQKFDYIFYTGGSAVGKIVMRAAAEHLTPVTLELGGKSPCIVDQSADIKVAAKRIVWGKFLNAGQTCVAPDYILVHESRADELVTEMKQAVKQFYGTSAQSSDDYGRIVNEKHFDRLQGLLEYGEVVFGGHSDRDDLYIEPTLLRQVDSESSLMTDEIFGPLLPILTYKDFDHAIREVNSRSKPLALYIFTKDSDHQNQIIEETSSGAVCINEVVSHLTVPNLPFGGVGESGMGAYHGKHSFDTFSHRKSILRRSTIIDPDLRYPPYTEGKERWIRRLL
jgi:aldehyde dehydrogenase (NAD+)